MQPCNINSKPHAGVVSACKLIKLSCTLFIFWSEPGYAWLLRVRQRGSFSAGLSLWRMEPVAALEKLHITRV